MDHNIFYLYIYIFFILWIKRRYFKEMFNVVEVWFNVVLTFKILHKDDSQLLYLFACLFVCG